MRAVSNEGEPKTTLSQRVDLLLQQHGFPFMLPISPETWGTRTPLFPVIWKDSGTPVPGIKGIFLAQQYPTMARLLIRETENGTRDIIHNFDPNHPFPERFNSEIRLYGNLHQQNPDLAAGFVAMIEDTLTRMKQYLT